MGPGFTVTIGRDGRVGVFEAVGAPQAQARLVSRAGDESLGAIVLGRLHYTAADERSHAARALDDYGRMGFEGLARLEGEFSMVVWDVHQGRLTAWRDPLGHYPLFWTEDEEGAAISTSLTALAARPSRGRLDPGFIADYLARPALTLHEPQSAATPYAGIERIPAGEITEIGFATRRATKTTRWDWADRLEDPGNASHEALVEEVGATLRAAVVERVGTTTGAHFSGGMDSTSVALLALRELAAKGRAPLHTLSLIYERLASLKGEAAYLRSALEGQSGIKAHAINGDDLLAYDGLGRVVAHEEPYTGLLLAAQEHALLDAAAGAGCDVVLTGEGGDDVLDVAPLHMARLVRRGRWLKAWGEAGRWARAQNVDPWPLFKRYGLEPLMPGSRGVRGARDGVASLREQGLTTVAPWIRTEFAKAHDIRGRAQAHARWLWHSTSDPGLSAMIGAIRSRTGYARRRLGEAHAGITLTHPFLDVRLLRLGLSLRLRYEQDPSRQKPLLADAMRDVLPASVRQRRAKGHFNEVYFKGLARNRVALEEMIRAAPTDDLGFLDKDNLIDSLRKIALGAEASGYAMMRLDQTLALVHWLAQRAGWAASGTAPQARPN